MLFKTLVSIFIVASVSIADTSKLNQDDAFYQSHVKGHLKPLWVKDTDSAMGRYNLFAKPLQLHTLIRAHGHMCDGLIIAYVELSYLLPQLFKDGIVDRTDLRVVAKNSPCLVDTSSLMSGARINHKTLSLDNALGSDFIVQRISTQQSYRVTLKDKTFLKALKTKEQELKTKKNVTSKDIDEVETLAYKAIEYIIHTEPNKLIKVTPLTSYQYQFKLDDIGGRSDIINKNIKRKYNEL